MASESGGANVNREAPGSGAGLEVMCKNYPVAVLF